MVVIKILGIVAEFNPFHNGHAYLLNKVRESGATHTVCVMSGNFVQRGDIAICSKVARAEMALRSGADLVLELPVTFATATAQRFARGAVATLNALGCIDALAFGSECGDAERLSTLADALNDNRVSQRIHEHLQSGITFAAARERALSECGYSGEILRNPNDTLAVSYIEAINAIGAKMTPIAVKRVGIAHDGGADGEFASASHIRSLINEGKAVSPYIPHGALQILEREINAGNAPFSLERLEVASLARLRSMTVDEMASLPDISEGLEHRLYRATREQASVADIISAVKTKRYTQARLRRIVLCALLGLDKSVCSIDPQYIRVLGMNEKGRRILAAAQPTLPLIARAKDASELNRFGTLLLAAEQRADNLAALASPAVGKCKSTLSQIALV